MWRLVRLARRAITVSRVKPCTLLVFILPLTSTDLKPHLPWYPIGMHPIQHLLKILWSQSLTNTPSINSYVPIPDNTCYPFLSIVTMDVKKFHNTFRPHLFTIRYILLSFSTFFLSCLVRPVLGSFKASTNLLRSIPGIFPSLKLWWIVLVHVHDLHAHENIHQLFHHALGNMDDWWSPHLALPMNRSCIGKCTAP